MRKENGTTTIDNIKVCVMRGFYDEEGEYREEYLEGIALSELPKEAVARIDFEYDITTLYSKRNVLVVAKSKQDIDDYRQLGARPHYFHGLLHCAEHDCHEGYMCIVTNLKTLRRLRKLN